MGLERRKGSYRYFTISSVVVCIGLMIAQVGHVWGESEMRPSRVLKITRMGDPILAAVAQEVSDPTSPEIHRIVEDMVATAMDFGSLAGLAAPQVKIPYRIVLFTVQGENGEEIPLTIMINPKWEPLSEEMEENWEGCLSLPGLVGRVPRYSHIRYTYQTLKGEVVTVEATGFHARVVQHECDHLDGKLYPQKMKNLSDFAFADEYMKYIRATKAPEQKSG